MNITKVTKEGNSKAKKERKRKHLHKEEEERQAAGEKSPSGKECSGYVSTASVTDETRYPLLSFPSVRSPLSRCAFSPPYPFPSPVSPHSSPPHTSRPLFCLDPPRFVFPFCFPPRHFGGRQFTRKNGSNREKIWLMEKHTKSIYHKHKDMHINTHTNGNTHTHKKRDTDYSYFFTRRCHRDDPTLVNGTSNSNTSEAATSRRGNKTNDLSKLSFSSFL